MGRLVEFPVEGGGSVVVETTEHAPGVVTRGMADSAAVERARQTFEEAVRRVEPAVQAVVARLKAIAESPDSIRIDFGMDLHAEAGAVITKASSTANFTVSVSWQRKQNAATGQ
ncbi:hypothetical protein GCM10010218_37810 [Streptomyces mashuensis]|uniref:Trypsin-co-occurring domain-containing protein n=1 Tax=Streptomyces mashuensis TaxID=33904 RepID=A0A919B5X2_9ACTN|nr:CU044_2847 family protein [Streptomyces mashuensis]GHF52796.1 hypothetical protein GCM10010218_37810 [Streptomyces mashuensis]